MIRLHKNKTTFQQGGMFHVVLCWLHEINHLYVSQISLSVCSSPVCL